MGDPRDSQLPEYPRRVAGAGGRISNVWTWFAAAPPKDPEKQWKESHSAMELARAWCRAGSPSPPSELLDALASTPFDDFRPWDVFAEWETPLDDIKGDTRSHDLIAVGRTIGGSGLLSVEAKAGETFGKSSLTEHLSRAGRGSRIPDRIALLVEAITGQRLDLPGEADKIPLELRDLGYQLFTATIGTVIEAGRRNCSEAALVIHELISADWKPDRSARREQTHRELAAFVAALGSFCSNPADPTVELAVGGSFGPFALHPTRFTPGGIDLYLAHVVTKLG